MNYRCRVPGKAVLMGEYAVTDGLPALAMAVDRFAIVSLASCSPDRAGLSAPQVWPETVGFRVIDRTSLCWDSSNPGWPKVRWTAGLIDRLIKALNPPGLGPFHLEIDTSSLFIDDQGQRTKLGLGSSSAIAVGLFRVLAMHLASERNDSPEALLQSLLPEYRAAQHGQGSGIDLATAVHGGLIAFRNQRGETSVKPVEWPEGLLLDFAWTGGSASTPKLLSRYRDWQLARPEQAARWHRMAATLLEQGLAALRRGETEELVCLLGEYGRGMRTMGGWMGVDLTPDVHLRIMQRAEQLGLAAKPSGAGVGDLSLIAGTCSEAMEAMSHWLRSEKITRVEMSPVRAGATLGSGRQSGKDFD